jgi:hypothetical protein
MPPFEVFRQRIEEQILVQYVVQHATSGQTLGLITADRADFGSQIVFASFACDSRIEGTGIWADTVIVFFRYLFSLWNFRKIYMELPEQSMKKAYSRSQNDGCQVEACKRRHIRRAGKWEDEITLSLTREGLRVLLEQVQGRDITLPDGSTEERG